MKFKHVEIQALLIPLMALTKTQHQQKKLDLIIVAQKTNQQTFIENLYRLNATHLNLSKMFPALRTSQFHVGDRQVAG